MSTFSEQERVRWGMSLIDDEIYKIPKPRDRLSVGRPPLSEIARKDPRIMKGVDNR